MLNVDKRILEDMRWRCGGLGGLGGDIVCGGGEFIIGALGGADVGGLLRGCAGGKSHGLMAGVFDDVAGEVAACIVNGGG